ncbi:S-Ena type endospore appendage [Halobacillus sp. KGW1]|uniref:S-Ena type endospore appendage n=1 Tax=Halobacillus sp. KGW1 TaxID=1793726 RepID=UPI000AE5EA49
MNQDHCIRVPVLYDWVTLNETFYKNHNIPLSQIESYPVEKLIFNIERACKNKYYFPLWEHYSKHSYAVTINVNQVHKMRGPMKLVLNGKESFSIEAEQPFSITVPNITSIVLKVPESCTITGYIGTVEVILKKAYHSSDRYKVSSFFTSAPGASNKADYSPLHVYVKTNRREPSSTIPQRFSLVIKGFLAVIRTDTITEEQCLVEVLPIHYEKNVHLHTPDGAEISYTIHDIQLHSTSACIDQRRCLKISHEIQVDLTLKSTKIHTIAIRGSLKHPYIKPSESQ